MSDWTARAGCRDSDPELFFPISDATASYAKDICWTRCDVRSECLRYALNNGEQHGVWGGATEQQRRGMTRRSAHAVAITIRTGQLDEVTR